MTEKEPLRSGEWYIYGKLYPGITSARASEIMNAEQQKINNGDPKAIEKYEVVSKK